MSRAVRPLCSVRHLARTPLSSINLSEALQQWETYAKDKPSIDIRNICTRLHEIYRERNESKKSKHLSDIFPRENETDSKKTLDEIMPQFEEKPKNDNETDLPERYPKMRNDPGDFYAQFTHLNLSIMKKRPYESNESSNEGKFQFFFSQ